MSAISLITLGARSTERLLEDLSEQVLIERDLAFAKQPAFVQQLVSVALRVVRAQLMQRRGERYLVELALRWLCSSSATRSNLPRFDFHAPARFFMTWRKWSLGKYVLCVTTTRTHTFSLDLRCGHRWD
jgi:hypothetical protein